MMSTPKIKQCQWCGKPLEGIDFDTDFFEQKGIVCDRCSWRGITLDVNTIGDLVYINTILADERTAPDCPGRDIRQVDKDGWVEKIICPSPPCPKECEECNLVQYWEKKDGK
jgi:hypothetical protein